MLSSVLKSPRAVKVNIEIMRAFVRLRHTLATHEDLSRRERGLTFIQKDARPSALLLSILRMKV